MVATIDSTIWERLLVEPSGDVISPETARALLAVTFKQSDIDRMNDLAALARAGKLTPKLKAEAEAYARIGNILGIIHSKARMALRGEAGPRGRRR